MDFDPLYERFFGALKPLVAARVKESGEYVSEFDTLSANFYVEPTSLYHERQAVYLLTYAVFERGNPTPSDVMIYVGSRESIEDRAIRCRSRAKGTRGLGK